MIVIIPLDFLENDILCSLPEDGITKFTQVILPFYDRQEMITSDLSQFARKTGCSVGEQDFSFAVTARIKQNFSRCRITGMVFKAEFEF